MMMMTNEELNHEITSLNSEIKKLKEEFNNINKSLNEKKEKIFEIRENFYKALLNPNENNNDALNKMNTNLNLLYNLYTTYEDNNKFNSDRNNMMFQIEKVQKIHDNKISKLLNEIKDLNNEIEKKDASIKKIYKEVNKQVVKCDIEQENYIINPTKEFIVPISEMSLSKEVDNNLTKLLNYTMEQNKQIIHEIKQIEESKNNSDNKTNNKENNQSTVSQKPTNGKRSSILQEHPIKTIKEANEEDEDEKTIYNDETERDEGDKNGDDIIESNNSSIILDSSGITPRNLKHLINSPRFIDKVVSNTKLIKPITLTLINDDKYIPASILKVKKSSKKHNNINDLQQHINASDLTIIRLKEELNKLKQLNIELTNKKEKLSEDLEQAQTKIEILTDQNDLINSEIKELEENAKIEE
jgi:hypothetical protein